MRRAHVVGAGLAGLSASVALAQAGRHVTLFEAAGQAGGRCRSYHDPQLDLIIDNGNHLVLSGNQAVNDYLATIGAADLLAGPNEAAYPFVDRTSGARWTVRINDGPVPWWVVAPSRRVPGTSLRDYLPLARLLGAAPSDRVRDRIPVTGPLWDRLIEPLLVAALNTPAAGASARLAASIVRETLAKGGRACRPRIAHPTLGAAFVEPALAWLATRPGDVLTGRRLRALEIAEGRVAALLFADDREAVAAGEPVVLAVPPWVATDLIPGLAAPDTHETIVNAHYKVAPSPDMQPIVGVVGGTAQWVFAFPDRLSVTISAASAMADEDRETLAARIWRDVAAVHGLSGVTPQWQIVREKRATFAATPEQDARRPNARTGLTNLFLAGDWTQTGLPATLEGALRSGTTAARLAMELPVA